MSEIGGRGSVSGVLVIRDDLFAALELFGAGEQVERVGDGEEVLRPARVRVLVPSRLVYVNALSQRRAACTDVPLKSGADSGRDGERTVQIGQETPEIARFEVDATFAAHAVRHLTFSPISPVFLRRFGPFFRRSNRRGVFLLFDMFRRDRLRRNGRKITGSAFFRRLLAGGSVAGYSVFSGTAMDLGWVFEIWRSESYRGEGNLTTICSQGMTV